MITASLLLQEPTPGNYSAGIIFDYEGGNKTAAATFDINVIEFVEGLFTDNIYTGSYLIDGSSWIIPVVSIMTIMAAAKLH